MRIDSFRARRTRRGWSGRDRDPGRGRLRPVDRRKAIRTPDNCRTNPGRGDTSPGDSTCGTEAGRGPPAPAAALPPAVAAPAPSPILAAGRPSRRRTRWRRAPTGRLPGLAAQSRISAGVRPLGFPRIRRLALSLPPTEPAPPFLPRPNRNRQRPRPLPQCARPGIPKPCCTKLSKPGSDTTSRLPSTKHARRSRCPRSAARVPNHRSLLVRPAQPGGRPAGLGPPRFGEAEAGTSRVREGRGRFGA